MILGIYIAIILQKYQSMNKLLLTPQSAQKKERSFSKQKSYKGMHKKISPYKNKCIQNPFKTKKIKIDEKTINIKDILPHPMGKQKIQSQNSLTLSPKKKQPLSRDSSFSSCNSNIIMRKKESKKPNQQLKQQKGKLQQKIVEENKKQKILFIEGSKLELRYKFNIDLKKSRMQKVQTPQIKFSYKIKGMEFNVKNLIKKENYKEAEKILKQIIQIDRNNVRAHYHLGKLYEILNRVLKSHQYYKKCLEIDEHDCKSLYYKGLCLYNMQEYENACLIFGEAADISSVGRLYIKKGLCEFNLSKYQPALKSFSKAVELGEKSRVMYEKMGDIYKSYKMYQIALQYYIMSQQKSSTKNSQLLKKKQQCNLRLKNPFQQQVIPSNTVSNFNTGLRKIRSCLSQKKYHQSYNEFIKIKNLTNLIPNLSQNQYYCICKGLMESSSYNQAKQLITIGIQQNIGIKAFELRARINFELGNFDDCEEDINNALNKFQSLQIPLINFIYPNTNESQIFLGLRQIMNKLQEINACSLTESQDIKIINRRKTCLNEALKLFDTSQSRDLSIIMEESNSTIHDSWTKRNQLLAADIFGLRNIRRIMQNWKQNLFDLDSIQQTASIAFEMVNSHKQDFSILPIHIVVNLMKTNEINFRKLNDRLGEILGTLCKKYPPTNTEISFSKIRSVNIRQIKMDKIDLFGKKMVFKNYRQIYSQIQVIANRAKDYLPFLQQVTKQICQKCGGTNFKSGLKLNINPEGLEERVLCRIIEKIFSEQLKNIGRQFLDRISMSSVFSLADYLKMMHDEWQKTIQKVILAKYLKNQPTHCYVYDFMRGKCMFDDLQSLEKAYHMFMDKEKEGKIQIIQVDNRLHIKTRDLNLKVKFKDMIGQIQLGLKFQSIKNEFNHSLYELHRSPFGPCFASVMWLSGYAKKTKKLTFKQKLKWRLKGLQHIRKFIYSDKVPFQFINCPKFLSGELFLCDFYVESTKLQGSVCNKNGQWLDYNQQNFKQAVWRKKKSNYKIQIVLEKQSLIIDSIYQVRISIPDAFLCLFHQENKVNWVEIDESVIGSKFFRLKFSSSLENFQQIIGKTLLLQKQINHLIAF